MLAQKMRMLLPSHVTFFAEVDSCCRHCYFLHFLSFSSIFSPGQNVHPFTVTTLNQISRFCLIPMPLELFLSFSDTPPCHG